MQVLSGRQANGALPCRELISCLLPWVFWAYTPLTAWSRKPALFDTIGAADRRHGVASQTDQISDINLTATSLQPHCVTAAIGGQTKPPHGSFSTSLRFPSRRAVSTPTLPRVRRFYRDRSFNVTPLPTERFRRTTTPKSTFNLTSHRSVFDTQWLRQCHDIERRQILSHHLPCLIFPFLILLHAAVALHSSGLQ